MGRAPLPALGLLLLSLFPASALRLGERAQLKVETKTTVRASATARLTRQSRRDQRLNHGVLVHTEVENRDDGDTGKDTDADTDTSKPQEPATPKVWDTTFIDNTSRPQDDLYVYATGGWQSRSELPPGYPEWSAFNEVNELVRYRIQKMIDEILAVDGFMEMFLTPMQKMIKTYHSAALDQKHRDERGKQPLFDPPMEAPTKPGEESDRRSHLALFELVTAPEIEKDLPKVLATLKADWGVGGPIGLGVEPDAKNSSWTILTIDQSGLGMPDRNYYLDVQKEHFREEYQRMIKKYFELVGEPKPAEATKHVMDIEHEIAKAHMDKVSRRDPAVTYNKISLEKWQEECDCKNFNWTNFLEAVGRTGETEFGLNETWRQGDINVASTKALPKIVEILTKDSVKTSAYLKFHAINSYANFDLSSDFTDAAFEFYGKTLGGVTQMRELWKRALAKTTSTFDEAIGKMYVEKYFSEKTKAKAKVMVHQISKALNDTIKELPWMSEETKQHALHKVAAMTVKIGYPDKWMDYEKMDIKPGVHFLNVKSARAFMFRYELSFANKETDKSQWDMSPQEINAYYNPSANEIVFPAGILQPPFFQDTVNCAGDKNQILCDAEDAINFGGIGGVVGHELTHGFDDEGRKYDADGNMNDWWTEADAKNFDAIANRMVDQTNKFEIYGTHPNGELTNGENLADLGGLTLAYKAFKAKLEMKCELDQIDPCPGIYEKHPQDNVTHQQRFFLSWARNWASVETKESVLESMEVDPHPPSPLRGNGPPSNCDAFYEAFNVTEKDKMYKSPEDRVYLWSAPPKSESEQGQGGSSEWSGEYSAASCLSPIFLALLSTAAGLLVRM